MKRTARKAFYIAIAGVVAAGIGLWLRHHFHVHNFADVEPFRLYRSGQPEGFDWARLMSKYQFRTVICLRPADEDQWKQWWPEENRAAQQLGFKLIELPMPGPVPTSQQADQFLAITSDSRNQPMLIHCRSGVNRTGTMVALYRMHVQGWSMERALADMGEMRDGPPKEKVVAFLQAYRPAVDSVAAVVCRAEEHH